MKRYFQQLNEINNFFSTISMFCYQILLFILLFIYVTRTHEKSTKSKIFHFKISDLLSIIQKLSIELNNFFSKIFISIKM